MALLGREAVGAADGGIVGVVGASDQFVGFLKRGFWTGRRLVGLLPLMGLLPFCMLGFLFCCLVGIRPFAERPGTLAEVDVEVRLRQIQVLADAREIRLVDWF